MKIYSNSSNTISTVTNKSTYLVEYLTMIILAIGVVGITSGSHSIGLPLYKLNPMHWVIYFVILFRKPSFSSIIVLAIALPLTSNMLTGHPIVIKSLIMGFELAIYGLIFISLIKYLNLAPIFAYIISQFSGHIAYYGLKYIFIKAQLIDGFIVSTSIILQFVVFVVLGITLYLSDKVRLKRKFKH
jgi:hypothetical protein